MIFLVLFLLGITLDVWRLLWSHMELPWWLWLKESGYDVETRVQSFYQEDPLQREWLPLQYSCLENSRGRKPWGHKALEMTNAFTLMNFKPFFFFLIYLKKKSHWNFGNECIDSIDGFGPSGHFGNTSSPYSVQFSSVAQSCPTLCDPMNCRTPARPPCPSPTPRVYSNSCPLSWWCHPAISSSVIPFSHFQSFPALGSFQMSQFFPSSGQSIRVSTSASVFPMNIQDWFPFGWTDWISL